MDGPQEPRSGVRPAGDERLEAGMAIEEMLAGALAGTAATVPMSIAMLTLNRSVPEPRRVTLPPREITANVARHADEALGSVDLERGLEETESLTALTVAAHFGYGAACGAIYGPLAAWSPARPLVKGIAFGLAVWSASYLGFLPAARLFPPARREPVYLNALMIAAHVVWGAALGGLTERWRQAPPSAGRR